MRDGELLPCDGTPRIDALEPAGLSGEQALEWVFLLDTLNFCFWSDDREEKFGVNHRGRLWTGYRSLCAALCRAVEVTASRLPVVQFFLFELGRFSIIKCLLEWYNFMTLVVA